MSETSVGAGSRTGYWVKFIRLEDLNFGLQMIKDELNLKGDW